MHLLAEDTATTNTAGLFSMLWPFALMFVVLYFLLIRPQQKRQKSRNMLLGGLKRGDKVVTIGGLHGTIIDINDQTVVLKVNDVTKMTFDRSAINSIAQSAATGTTETKQAEKADKKEESGSEAK